MVTLTAVVALSALNALGIVAGKITQNILTATKVLGIGAIVLAGVGFSFADRQFIAASPRQPRLRRRSPSRSSLCSTHMAAGRTLHTSRRKSGIKSEICRELVFGIAGITLIYLMVNATYIYVLDFDVARHTTTPAADVMDACLVLGEQAPSASWSCCRHRRDQRNDSDGHADLRRLGC